MLHNQFAIDHAPEKLERVAIAADWMNDNQVLLGCIERDSVDPAPFVHGFLAFPHGFEDSVIVCTLINVGTHSGHQQKLLVRHPLKLLEWPHH